jgi:hypothetical protein
MIQYSFENSWELCQDHYCVGFVLLFGNLPPTVLEAMHRDIIKKHYAG